MSGAARVFISYSHEHAEHDARVLALAARLRAEGLDAWIDRYVAGPEEGWPRWVRDQIDRADFVVSICTPMYRRAFEGTNRPGVGLGVNQEGYLITQALYDAGHRTPKYLAAAFGSSRDHVPGELRGQPFFRLLDEYDALYRHCTGQPAVVVPSLGAVRTLPPLPVRSAGNEEQSKVSAYLTPDQQDLARLAPADGLFLSRIINPIVRERGDIVSTIWMAASGPLQYWVDSVRIRDYPQFGLGGNPVVTVPLDAEYRFTFEEGSDRVHALNPALSVGPDTRRRVAFSLAATMERFYEFGKVLIWAQYQASDGRSGAVLLIETPPEAARLARLAGVDLRFALGRVHDLPQIVVTPQGLQRGIEQSHLPECCFVQVRIGQWSTYGWSRERLVQLRRDWQHALRERAALSERLSRGPARGELAAWFDEEPSRVVADLLGGVADAEATAQLTNALAIKAFEQVALHGLAVRHLVTGDDLLCAYLLEHGDLLATQADLFATLTSVVAARPGRGWIDLLGLIGERRPDWLTHFVAATRPDLTDADVARLHQSPGGPLGVPLFLRGTMNDWKTIAPFTYHGQGIYQASMPLDAGRYEFKIGAMNWGGDNYGGADPDVRVRPGTPVPIVRHEMSHNLVLDILDGGGGCVFTLNAALAVPPTLSVEIAGARRL